MESYRTITKEAKSEQIIEKSRFIAHAKPVSTKEEAEEYIAKVRKEYKDATHNVPAMVIGDTMQVQWGSDDGEPQGTSGAPIVQMLVNEGVTNIVIIVTRYFGGIKLGTGGLVRAYTSSAKLALEAAGISQVKEMLKLKYSADYCFLSALQKSQSQGTYTIENVEYGESVVLTIILEKENEDKVMQNLANITSGKGQVVSKEIAEVKIPE